MKTLSRSPLFTLLLAALALSSSCDSHDPVIRDTETAQHLGQNVTVEGVVTAVSVSKKGNTFINFGGVYPHQTFTGWIPAGTSLASDPSVHLLQGKKVKITGTIQLYQGKPEIKVLSKGQISEE